jgi:hypothetical protein
MEEAAEFRVVLKDGFWVLASPSASESFHNKQRAIAAGRRNARAAQPSALYIYDSRGNLTKVHRYDGRRSGRGGRLP